jgi:hypothetical protein
MQVAGFCLQRDLSWRAAILSVRDYLLKYSITFINYIMKSTGIAIGTRHLVTIWVNSFKRRFNTLKP